MGLKLGVRPVGGFLHSGNCLVKQAGPSYRKFLGRKNRPFRLKDQGIQLIGRVVSCYALSRFITPGTYKKLPVRALL
jgi:hypothetical protein